MFTGNWVANACLLVYNYRERACVFINFTVFWVR